MGKFRKYDVSFAGLKLGEHEFEFQIAQPFFDLFEFDQDFSQPNLVFKLKLDKKENFLTLKFGFKGSVELICDITNEAYNQELRGVDEVIVKFGEEFDDSDDEIWVIPQGEHTINIAQAIYEMILLSIPVKRIHPDVLEGKSHSEMIDLLEKYSPHEEEEEEEEEENSDEEMADPRWEILKKLKNNNN